MEIPVIKFKKIDEDAILPKFAHDGDVGMDVFSPKDTIIKAKSWGLVGLGLISEFDTSIEMQIRSKSGIALKNGCFVLNSPGTVEGNYRGELGVIMANLSDEDFVIKKGQKVAQLVFKRNEQVKVEITTEELSESNRGNKGFGSTGQF